MNNVKVNDYKKKTIVRYSEIFLKGLNRGKFEKKLVDNIKIQTSLSSNNVQNKRNRIILNDWIDVANIFGIRNYSYVLECNADEESIKHCINEFIEMKKNNGSKIKKIRVTANRLTKNFHLNSMEIQRKFGEYLFDKGFKVSLEDYDLNIYIEISDFAYVFVEKKKGLGGLPVGISGLVTIQINNEKDIKAAIMMMKRGCSVEVIASKFNKNMLKLSKYYPGQIKVVSERSKNSLSIVSGEDSINKLEKDKLYPLIGQI